MIRITLPALRFFRHHDDAVVMFRQFRIVGDDEQRGTERGGRAKISLMIAWPVAVSRLPVGSSAKMIAGSSPSRARSLTRCARRPTVAPDNGQRCPARPLQAQRRRDPNGSAIPPVRGTATFSSAVIVGSK